MEETVAERIKRFKEEAKAFSGEDVYIPPFTELASFDDFMDFDEMQPMPESYCDKQGRSWYTSADKQKYNRKHKGKGKGKKKGRRNR